MQFHDLPTHRQPYPTGVTNRDLQTSIESLQTTVTRLETRLCKLIEHLGAQHLIHQPAQNKRKEQAA